MMQHPAAQWILEIYGGMPAFWIAMGTSMAASLAWLILRWSFAKVSGRPKREKMKDGERNPDGEARGAQSINKQIEEFARSGAIPMPKVKKPKGPTILPPRPKPECRPRPKARCTARDNRDRRCRKHAESGANLCSYHDRHNLPQQEAVIPMQRGQVIATRSKSKGYEWIDSKPEPPLCPECDTRHDAFSNCPTGLSSGMGRNCERDGCMSAAERGEPYCYYHRGFAPTADPLGGETVKQPPAIFTTDRELTQREHREIADQIKSAGIGNAIILPTGMELKVIGDPLNVEADYQRRCLGEWVGADSTEPRLELQQTNDHEKWHPVPPSSRPWHNHVRLVAISPPRGKSGILRFFVQDSRWMARVEADSVTVIRLGYGNAAKLSSAEVDRIETNFEPDPWSFNP